MRVVSLVLLGLLVGACGNGGPAGDDPSTLASEDDGPAGSGDGDAVLTGDGNDAGDSGSDGDGDSSGDASPNDSDGLTPYEQCFEEILDPTVLQPDYTGMDMVVANHCSGTNHQNITGVERVVFLGDSVTVGTPPTASSDWYRNRVADRLATRFNLSAPNTLWRNVNYISGETMTRESGDFASCARYGARADDLARDDTQLEDCLPEDERGKTTLVVMTMGGNDLNSIMQGFSEGKSHDELWAETRTLIDELRSAVAWIKTPGRFPKGVFVILANLYEYTDGTGLVSSCPAATLAGFEDTTDPALTEMVIWAMEQYVQLSVDFDTDLVFLLESFCGHGYQRNNPEARCYRGPDSELWFDDTCIHPNAVGHGKLADMVMAVVGE